MSEADVFGAGMAASAEKNARTLSLRDEIALKFAVAHNLWTTNKEFDEIAAGMGAFEAIAVDAYSMADAFLAERERQRGAK